VPNDPGNEPHDNHGGVRVRQHFGHPDDAVQVQHIAMPIGLLIEEQEWLTWAGREQLDVITKAASTECTEPA